MQKEFLIEERTKKEIFVLPNIKNQPAAPTLNDVLGKLLLIAEQSD